MNNHKVQKNHILMVSAWTEEKIGDDIVVTQSHRMHVKLKPQSDNPDRLAAFVMNKGKVTRKEIHLSKVTITKTYGHLGEKGFADQYPEYTF